MNKYICEKCGVEILSVGKKRVILCERCYNRQKQEKYSKMYKKPIKTKRKPRGDFRSIRQVIAEMEEYNRKHGTCLTYGTYVSLMYHGSLTTRDWRVTYDKERTIPIVLFEQRDRTVRTETLRTTLYCL